MGKQKEYRSNPNKRRRVRVVPEWKEKGLPPPDEYYDVTNKKQDYGDVDQEKALELINAVRESDMLGVRRLVRAGARINCPMDGGWTALHHAAVGGQLDIVRYLVIRGADKTMMTNDAKLAVDLVNDNYTEITELLR
ncbi:protein phosphatase 1 regulatory subunit 27-like [Saccoglossus kowalevskii]|uniref:Protein phosphatase 1 regulatory subunit 27-like n=1 Tax=Saccoglossus kowalevskii TaxID=10224 RepID=A0ABM0GJC3_SACKO|nr:PREDICTED: protein phosphatase 1 regulatory subunit 27-like [Saccoglossus kowalevskii]